jgi:hypothetical protein
MSQSPINSAQRNRIHSILSHHNAGFVLSLRFFGQFPWDAGMIISTLNLSIRIAPFATNLEDLYKTSSAGSTAAPVVILLLPSWQYCCCPPSNVASTFHSNNTATLVVMLLLRNSILQVISSHHKGYGRLFDFVFLTLMDCTNTIRLCFQCQ